MINMKQIEKEIKKALDNLDNVNISNTLKAEAIMLAIQPLLEPKVLTVRTQPLRMKNND